MPAMYEVTFLPEGRKSSFAGSRGHYYELEDGSRIDLLSTPAWCRRCAGMTDAEKIEPLAQIDEELSDLHDPNSELYRFTQRSLLPELDALLPREQFRLELIEKARKRRAWRERRRSGPKCIVCGSTDVFVFPLDERVPHPAGPGSVVVNIRGMCSTEFNEWFFTPEGDRMPRDTKPTYWRHPDLDNSPSAATRWVKSHMNKSGGLAYRDGEGNDP